MMKKNEFDLDVSYSQVTVFHAGLDEPFNDWTDDHVNQGFAWRRESVSFKTLIEAGQHRVELVISDEFQPVGSGVVRAILVPFTVPKKARIEIASISDGTEHKVPAGSYSLRYEAFMLDKTPHVRFSFLPKSKLDFVVEVADAELSPPKKLLLTAKPAG